MSLIVFTDLDNGEDISTLEGLEAALVADANRVMASETGASVFLPAPPQGGTSATAEEVALRTLCSLRDAQKRMEERRVRLAYFCSRCADERCSQDAIRADGARHSPVNFIAAVLLRLAEAIGLLQAMPDNCDALEAAVIARNAAIEGDGATVDAFSRAWLGLMLPERWREAVEMALLGDWVNALGEGAATDVYIQDLLRRHADAEHRNLQPLWERRVRGKRTILLSSPLGATPLTVADMLIEHHTPESEVLASELEDSRLATVLRALQPEESRFAWDWAKSGESWAEVAAAVGQPAYGERVRSKLKRLGTRYVERTAAAAAWRQEQA
ncbi:hypothetical protein [Streptomyces anulatus]|uniref:hypothetical protein n=1 Tax=Streptomyces anulatus TaxID=1892 RepID=UPI0033E6366B